MEPKWGLWKKALLALIVGSAAGFNGSAPAEADSGVVICIDPGHQDRADNGMEPMAPGSESMKPKVTGGATGVATGQTEYELNLKVSLLLKGKLEERGYEVVMTRETNQARLSNIERAEIGNDAGADLTVRIHADGSPSSSAQGVTLLHPAAGAVPDELYEASRSASEIMLKSVIEHTGAVNRGLSPRDDLTGFNWSKVPVLLIEMGFMSNPEEDRLMATDSYQELLAEGMAAGIETYFAGQEDLWTPEPWEGGLLLMRDAFLYERKGRAFIRSKAALTPQLLRATERVGDWYKIDTWLGPMWLQGDGSVVENPLLPTNSKLELRDETLLYDTPAEGGGTLLGRLAPQQVSVLWEWNGWKCVDTWLGGAWIRAEDA